MLALLKSLSLPFLSLIFMMIASGFFNTFVSLRLQMEGFSHNHIGIITSALYAGILVGSFRMDRWIAKRGHVASFAILALILTCLVLAQSLWIQAVYWSCLRFLSGICTAGVFIVIESWFLLQCAPNMRGTILSLYLAIFYAAISLGQCLLDLSNPFSYTPYLITMALLVISAIPVLFHRSISSQSLTKEAVPLDLIKQFRISPLGFIGGIVSGMLLAVVYGLVPIYANAIGMSISEVGTFMAVLIFGGFCLQLPLGRLADKKDRRSVLNAVSFVTAILGIIIASLESPPFMVHLFLAWIFGGFSFTLYPISMAYAIDSVKEEEIIAATGGFVFSYGIGAIIGPLLASQAMTLFGTSALFYFFAAICAMLGFVGLKKRADVKYE